MLTVLAPGLREHLYLDVGGFGKPMSAAVSLNVRTGIVSLYRAHFFGFERQEAIGAQLRKVFE